MQSILCFVGYTLCLSLLVYLFICLFIIIIIIFVDVCCFSWWFSVYRWIKLLLLCFFRLGMKKVEEGFMGHLLVVILLDTTIQLGLKKVMFPFALEPFFLMHFLLICITFEKFQDGLHNPLHHPGRTEQKLKSRVFWTSWMKMKKLYEFFLIVFHLRSYPPWMSFTWGTICLWFSFSSLF